MSHVLRQSTQVVVRIGPFMDATDAVTPETGITLGAADQAEALKAAGAATVDISGNTWAAIANCGGWYDLTLTTTDTNTIGDLTIVVQDTSVCLPVFARFQVIEEAAYDTIYAASALPASTTNITAGTITTVTNLTNAPTAGDLTATMKASVNTEVDTALSDYGALKPTVAGRTLDVSVGGEAGLDWANIGTPTTAQNLSATNIDTDQVVASVTGAVGSVTGSVGSVVGLTVANLDATVSSRATQASVDTIDGIVDAILVDTAEIGVAGAGLTAINLPDQTMNITGDITGNLSGSVGSVTGAVGSVTVVSDKTGYALSAAGVDAILDDVVEGAFTLRAVLRGYNAALLSKASGLATTTAVFRDISDTKDRITATVDADGNRTAITLDLA